MTKPGVALKDDKTGVALKDDKTGVALKDDKTGVRMTKPGFHSNDRSMRPEWK
jgi:hypothetical protein